MLKTRPAAAGIENADQYSMHSLRAGYVTFARDLGMTDGQIARQTGHKDLKTLMIYDRPEDALKSEENLMLVNAI